MALQGKIALLTGAASGIGLATAKLFLKEGAEGVALVDISQEALDRGCLSIDEAHKGRLLLCPADVSSDSDNATVLEKVIQKFGRLDIAVINAGVTQRRCKTADLDVAEFDRVMSVNCRGCFLGLKYSLKAMLKSPHQGKGCSIVLTASQLGLDGSPQAMAYASSKFAVRGMALSAAAEYGKQGIRINALVVSIRLRAMTDSSLSATATAMLDNWSSADHEWMAGMTMLNRLGTSDDIAQAMLFLASAASSNITGTSLKVDGGYSKFA